jgi:peptidoglycan hydrolase-like protein with peptidoglycan-binding domain
MSLYKTLPTALVALLIAASFGQSAFAQTVSGSVSSGIMCPAYTLNIGIGAHDYSSNNEVTNLQKFLVNQGYFNASSVGTGSFGPLTFAAVVRFQSAHNLPATGFVGPLTRGVIGTLYCGTPIPTPTPTPTPSGTVSLYDLSPSSGSVGSSVLIDGSGFTSSNTILFDGSIIASNVSSTVTGLGECTANVVNCDADPHGVYFTIPTSIGPNCSPGSACPDYVRLVTPGQYNVTVENSNGTSNTLVYTVTSGVIHPTPPLSSTISITGLNAPSTLSVGQTGTWTVNVLAGSYTGNLQYSVNWGDEGYITNASNISEPVSSQTSATFTHTYQNIGTYTPTFTVTDSNGNTTSASNTVTVKQIYTQG